MAEKSSWDQANIWKKLSLVWRNSKKFSQIIKDYFYLPFSSSLFMDGAQPPPPFWRLSAFLLVCLASKTGDGKKQASTHNAVSAVLHETSVFYHVPCQSPKYLNIYVEYRAVSGVFRTIDPPAPLHPASVSSPAPKAGRGYTLAGR